MWVTLFDSHVLQNRLTLFSLTLATSPFLVNPAVFSCILPRRYDLAVTEIYSKRTI